LPINSLNQTFTHACQRYLADRDQLLKIEYCFDFTQHCQFLHQFFKYLFVSQRDGSLIHNESDNEFMRDVVPLFAYWKSIGYEPYLQFYALYFDCLARLFVVALHESWLNVANDKYAYQRTKAEQAHAMMSMVMEHLIGSEYEERYARQLARYYDLLSFVQSEKDKYEK